MLIHKYNNDNEYIYIAQNQQSTDALKIKTVSFIISGSKYEATFTAEILLPSQGIIGNQNLTFLQFVRKISFCLPEI